MSHALEIAAATIQRRARHNPAARPRNNTCLAVRANEDAAQIPAEPSNAGHWSNRIDGKALNLIAGGSSRGES